MYQITQTHRFKKDVNIYKNNTKIKDRLADIFSYLLKGEKLPSTYKDHPLKGIFKNYRECHIAPDILLIYKINAEEKLITLAYIGSHSSLF